MSSEEIQQECEKAYAQIRESETQIKEVRAICKHEKTFEGNYSWRIGSIEVAEICSYCGEVMKFLHRAPIINQKIHPTQ